MIRIILYNIPSLDSIGLKKKEVFQTFTYYIKHGKVLRNDEIKSGLKNYEPTVSDNIVFNLNSAILQPTYLIDLDDETAYLIYKDSTDGNLVYKSLLQDFTLDPFYRGRDTDTKRKKSISSTISIDSPLGTPNTKNWIKTVARERADTVYLEYEKEAWPVESPLNAFLPQQIDKVNVSRAFFKVDGTGINQEHKKFHLMMEVDKVLGGPIDDQILEILSNAKYTETQNEVMERYYKNN